MASPWTWPILALGPAIDVGDEADDRDAVESASPMPVSALVKPGPGTTREDADRAGGPRRGVGHHAGGSLVRDQQVGHALGLEGVPELVVLGAGDAEDAADALAAERRRRRLGTGHLALDAVAPGEAAQLDAAGLCLRSECGHGRGRARTLPPASSSRRFTLGDTFGFPPGRYDCAGRSARGGIHRLGEPTPAAHSDVFVSARRGVVSIASRASAAGQTDPRARHHPYNRFRAVGVALGPEAEPDPARARRPVTRGVFAEMLDAFQDDRPGVADGIEDARPIRPSRSCRGRAGRCESWRPSLSWTWVVARSEPAARVSCATPSPRLAWPVSRARASWGWSSSARSAARSVIRLPGCTPGGMFSTQIDDTWPRA